MIPQTFHFVWLGNEPLSDRNRAWVEGWPQNNPGWEAVLWVDRDELHTVNVELPVAVRRLPPLVNRWAYDNLEKWVTGRAAVAARSDIVRMEIVARLAGSISIPMLRRCGPSAAYSTA